MQEILLEEIKKNPCSYKPYYEYAKYLEDINLKQAYLTYENALYYCKDMYEKEQIQKKLDEIAYRNGKVEPASIVILSYNNKDLTKQCIESIRETTPESAREIVIVDNNSQDDSVEYLRQQSDIVLIENNFNAGFPGGCNIGIRASNPKNDIFLLNNDTILCANSLYTLRMGLYEKDNYGSAGAVSNNVVNGQQVIEDHLEIDTYKEFALQTNIPCKDYEIKIVLIGFALLIKRNVLNQVGLLDERFNPGNYEDDDYGLRILEKNYQNILIRNSFIIHLGGKSFISESRRKLMLENSLKLKTKYNFDAAKDTSYFLHSDFTVNFYENVLERIDDNKKVLDGTCDMGARLLHLAYKYPKLDFYGLDSNIQCAMISSHLEGVHISHYFEIENNPFKDMKFDLIALDTTKIKKSELEVYLRILKGMLKPDGKLVVLTKNMSFYENWYPVLSGEKRVMDTENVFNVDVDEAIRKLELKPTNWLFYFPQIPDEVRKKLDLISKAVGEGKHVTVNQIAYTIVL